MIWQKILNDLGELSAPFQLNQPANGTVDIGIEFDMTLPQELIDFYRETDGLSEYLNGEKIGNLIWTVESVLTENRKYRSNPIFQELYMPFDNVLFIGDAGNGDLFAYSIQQKAIRRTDIYAWDHEDDSRTWVAPDLKTFVVWWIGGKIKV